jgi:CheY-like chemotaxis protein
MNMINVLIVDDDELDRYLARRQLSKVEEIGTIVEVDDGQEALSMFEDGTFETSLGPHPPRTLVLLDINMPRLSGFDVLDRLERDHAMKPPSVSVIAMLTSSSDFGDRQRAMGYSVVDAYIEKPLTPEKLQAILHDFWPKGVSS